MQGLAWSEREVRERAERERTALLQRQQAIDVKDQVSVSPSLAAAVPEQHLQCLTAWVNSALPEGMMMSDPSGKCIGYLIHERALTLRKHVSWVYRGSCSKVCSFCLDSW